MNELDFPAWLRVSHLINFFLIGLLIRSGWQIVATHLSKVAEPQGRSHTP